MKISKKRLREIIKEEIDWSQEDKVYREVNKTEPSSEQSSVKLPEVMRLVAEKCNAALEDVDPWDGDEVAHAVLEIIEPYLGE
jgi:hypothetical protein